ncbi:hypothetical protein NY40_0342 [Helicobacter pylori NY40]|uniref:Uncharacterized protein n=1 Tax=Helicobacter pylori NY40 TaxID=1426844 RepID=A0A060PRY7_HELPX|nr:hypothetical protein NY40_0342 [Helicobacter pylori NY40]
MDYIKPLTRFLIVLFLEHLKQNYLKILLKTLNAIWGFLDPLSLKQNYYKIY